MSAEMLARFTVQANPSDNVAPTASADAGSVTGSGGTGHTFSVTYSDDVAVDVASVGAGDVVVTGPGGYGQTAAFVSVDAATNGTPRTATYRITPPGGSWDAADNGTYTVSLAPGQVADTAGNAAAAGGLTAFSVNIAPPGPGTPTAAAAAPDVTSGGAAYHYFTVTYSDDEALDWRTITPGDVEVTGPGGFSQLAYLANFPSGQDPARVVITYRVTAPGGSWGNNDNGLYAVRVRPGEVADAAGNFVAAGAVGTFSVAIADWEAPGASLAASDVTVAGAAYHYFTVTYTDAGAVDGRTIGAGDVEVTGPGGFSQAAYLANFPSGQDPARLVITYRVTAPGGSWGHASNGTYAVLLRENQVADTAGNVAPARPLGTFRVALPAPATGPGNSPPAVESLSTNASAVGAASEGQLVTLSAAFSDPDTGDTHVADIDWGDGTVTRLDPGPGARSVSASHAYAAGGAYAVRLTVGDSAGHSGGAATRAFVTGAGVRDGVLQVVGTAGADRVLVTPSGDQVYVTAAFVAGGRRGFPGGGITSVVILGGPGDDYLSLYDTVAARGALDGGDGDDTLFGGRSSLLIGGAGADRIEAGGGDDTLVSGPTRLDGDPAALLAVLGGTRPLAAADCLDDGRADVLSGGKGTDRFFANLSGGGVLDALEDLYLSPDEDVTDV